MKSAQPKKNEFKYVAVLAADHLAIAKKAKERGEVIYAFIGKIFKAFIESEKKNGKAN